MNGGQVSNGQGKILVKEDSEAGGMSVIDMERPDWEDGEVIYSLINNLTSVLWFVCFFITDIKNSSICFVLNRCFINLYTRVAY